MQLFLYQFGFTRMAQNAEKDILVVYSKRNICFHYRSVIHVITLFFYAEYDGNIFILIRRHQDGLEHREGHPGGVQQEKCMFLLWTCDTCYYPIFLWRIRWKYFHFDLASPGWPRTPRRTSWWSTARQNINFELSACYRLNQDKIIYICHKKQGYNMYHMSIMGTYVSLAVLHQDVLLGIQGHPGDEKSRQKYFHRIYHKKIQL